MNFRKAILYSIVAISALAAVSCHKSKDDTDTKLTLSGTLTFDSPIYVLKGDVLKITPKGLSGNNVDIGYYWTASPMYTTKDTTRCLGDPETNDGTYNLVVKDTSVMTFTIGCVAFADGYYTKSASYYCTLVDPDFGGSLDGDGILPGTPKVRDGRTGKYLFYKTIGDRDWTVRNVNYPESGRSFASSPAMDDIFGRYYTWEEAQSVCPTGWRLPSDADWLALAQVGGYTGTDASADFLGAAGSLMANATFNGSRMWEYWPAVKITNSTGFAALPTGYGIAQTEDEYFGNEYAVFWSSESYDEEQGVYRMINVNRPDVMRGAGYKNNFLAPVRCVRDSK